MPAAWYLAGERSGVEPDSVVREGQAGLAQGGGAVPREARVACRSARPSSPARQCGGRVGDAERAAETGPGGAAAVPSRARPAAAIASPVRVVPQPTRRWQRRETAGRSERRGGVGGAREARPARRRPTVVAGVAARGAGSRASGVGGRDPVRICRQRCAWGAQGGDALVKSGSAVVSVKDWVQGRL